MADPCGPRNSVEDILHPIHLQKLAKEWLLEDTSNFEFSGIAIGNIESKAAILCKSKGVLAGTPFADAVFAQLNCTCEWKVKEGSWVSPMTVVAHVSGRAKDLLIAERIVLNCIARASGVASAVRKVKESIEFTGWKGELAGTRKTTPGFRMVEKYALLVGGASMHRYDLSSMIMLKDNHVQLSGSITDAIQLVRKVGGFSQKIEVECQSLEEALEAGKAKCDIVMLDNFSPKAFHDTAAAVKSQFPNILIEASGGLTEENIMNYVGPHADIISTSTFIQGYSIIDFSMKIKI